MKAQFKFVVLFLMFHSVLYSASICSDREFVNSFKSGVLRTGANAYCQGNTFYVVTQVYSQSDFEQLHYLDRAYADALVSVCSHFDDTLRLVNSSRNSNLRGKAVYVYEYNGQRIQYSCP